MRHLVFVEQEKTSPFTTSHRVVYISFVLFFIYICIYISHQIAKFEDVTFELCECVDAKTGEEVRHPKGMCVVPGLVVVKIIYTPEEAERRKIEDREVIVAFEKTLKHVRDGREGGRERERGPGGGVGYRVAIGSLSTSSDVNIPVAVSQKQKGHHPRTIGRYHRHAMYWYVFHLR